jgi:solute carrier family 50 (sugar transporter)
MLDARRILTVAIACSIIGAAESALSRPAMLIRPVRTLKQAKLTKLARPLSRPAMSLAAAANVWAPVAGVFTSNALYFSPLAATLERTKAGSMGDLNPLPAAITVLSTIAWLQYGLSVANPFVVASNVPGLTAAIAGFVMMLPLMRGSSDLRLTQTTFVGGCAATLGLWTWLVFSRVSVSARSSILGYWASALFVVLCAAPLSTIRKVIQRKNASSVYAPATAAQCANCGLWTAYGYLGIGDVFVWGPNLTGLVLGLLQLALKLIYPSSGKASSSGTTSFSEDKFGF